MIMDIFFDMFMVIFCLIICSRGLGLFVVLNIFFLMFVFGFGLYVLVNKVFLKMKMMK